MISETINTEIYRAIDGFIELHGISSDDVQRDRTVQKTTRQILHELVVTVIKYVMSLPPPSAEVIEQNTALKSENTRLEDENAELRNGICALYEKLERY